MRSLNASESQVLSAIIQACHHSPEVVVWRANTGGARPEDTRAMDVVLGMLKRSDLAGAVKYLRDYAKKRGQRVRFGPKGQADLMGYFTDRARHQHPGTILAIEVKRHDGKPAMAKASPEQIAFLQGIAAAGGVAAVLDDAAHLPAVLSGAWNQPEIHPQAFG